MQGMMDGMMGGGMMGAGMMWGAGLFWLLGVVLLVLAIAALAKYLFFDGGRREARDVKQLSRHAD
jgi:uncharacterized membrane protein